MASRVPRPEARRTPAADRMGAAALGHRFFRRQMAAVLTAARDANAYSASFRLGAGPVAGFTIYFHSGAEEYRHAERPPDDDATLHAHDDPCKPPADAQPQARRRGARGGKNHCSRDRMNSTGSSTAGAAAVGRAQEENARRPEAAEHDSDAREARPGNPPTGRTAERQSCPPPSTASVPPPPLPLYQPPHSRPSQRRARVRRGEMALTTSQRSRSWRQRSLTRSRRRRHHQRGQQLRISGVQRILPTSHPQRPPVRRRKSTSGRRRRGSTSGRGRAGASPGAGRGPRLATSGRQSGPGEGLLKWWISMSPMDGGLIRLSAGDEPCLSLARPYICVRLCYVWCAGSWEFRDKCACALCCTASPVLALFCFSVDGSLSVGWGCLICE